MPDVSFLADPNYGVYVVYDGGWYQIGGTSAGSPQWSALIALANQGRAAANLSAPDATLYSLAKAGTDVINATYFHDITSADDISGPGYDLVTGLGSPVAGSLVPALRSGGTTTVQPAFSLSLSPASQTVAPGSNAAYTVTVSGSGGYSGTVNFSFSGLPSGVTGTFSPASITSSGSTTLTLHTASTTTAGAYTVTVTGKDATGTAHSVTATLVIQSTMTVSAINYSLSESGRTIYMGITLAAVNGSGVAVPNASVAITLYVNGSAYASGAATTASNGEVTFTLANPSVVTYSTKVTGLTATGLTWNGAYPANSYIP